MKKIVLSISAAVTVVAVVFGIVLSSSKKAEANPLFFPPSATTNSAASTSPVFMLAATATTTVIYYDTFYQTTTGANTKAIDAALLLRLAATSTSAVFNVVYEYAHKTPGYDCTATPTFCEWYQDNYTQSSTGYPSAADLTFENFKIIRTLAAGTSTKIFSVPTPTRYVRVNVKLTGAPGNAWGEIVPSKEWSE